MPCMKFTLFALSTGSVVNRRLMGILGVSRAFGDIEYKCGKEKAFPHIVFSEDPLIVRPDVTEIHVLPEVRCFSYVQYAQHQKHS